MHDPAAYVMGWALSLGDACAAATDDFTATVAQLLAKPGQPRTTIGCEAVDDDTPPTTAFTTLLAIVPTLAPV